MGPPSPASASARARIRNAPARAPFPAGCVGANSAIAGGVNLLRTTPTAWCCSRGSNSSIRRSSSWCRTTSRRFTRDSSSRAALRSCCTPFIRGRRSRFTTRIRRRVMRDSCWSDARLPTRTADRRSSRAISMMSRGLRPASCSCVSAGCWTLASAAASTTASVHAIHSSAIFHSNHFKLVRIQRLPDVGSDHFPILAELQYEADAQRQQQESVRKPGDEEIAQEKLEAVS